MTAELKLTADGEVITCTNMVGTEILSKVCRQEESFGNIRARIAEMCLCSADIIQFVSIDGRLLDDADHVPILCTLKKLDSKTCQNAGRPKRVRVENDDSNSVQRKKRPRHGEGAVSSTAAAAMEELWSGCEELRQLREATGTDGNGSTSAGELLLLLRRLARLPIDSATLRSTGAGREVNQKWLKCHADRAVRAESSGLVQRWMAEISLNAVLKEMAS